MSNLSFREWLLSKENNNIYITEDANQTAMTGIELIKFLSSKEALSPSALSDWPVAKLYKPFIYVAPNYGVSDSTVGTYFGKANSSHDNLIEYLYDKMGEEEAKAVRLVYNQVLNGTRQNGAVGRYASYLNIDGLKNWYDLTKEQLNYLKEVKIISVYEGGVDLQNIVNDIKKRETIYGSDLFVVIGDKVTKA